MARVLIPRYLILILINTILANSCAVTTRIPTDPSGAMSTLQPEHLGEKIELVMGKGPNVVGSLSAYDADSITILIAERGLSVTYLWKDVKQAYFFREVGRGDIIVRRVVITTLVVTVSLIGFLAVYFHNNPIGPWS